MKYLKFILISLVLIPTAAAGSNRVWDGSKGMSLTYTWNPMSFSGFYYDLDNNIESEELTISLRCKSLVGIAKGRDVEKMVGVECRNDWRYQEGRIQR